MNKLLISTLIAGGLLLLQSPEAAAHDKHRSKTWSHGHYAQDVYRYERRPIVHRKGHRHKAYKRSHKMPKWLQRQRAFQHWYHYTSYSLDRRLTWDQLFDFYLWEQRHRRYRRY